MLFCFGEKKGHSTDATSLPREVPEKLAAISGDFLECYTRFGLNIEGKNLEEVKEKHRDREPSRKPQQQSPRQTKKRTPDF